MEKLNLHSKKILITGGNGFLGKHVSAYFRKQGVRNLFLPSSKEYDFRKKLHCRKAVQDMDIIIHLAAKVGGIGYNQQHPAEMFYDNMTMGVHLMHEAYEAHIKKFVAIGTICCYPKFTPVPFREEELWNGYPEETNAPYGLAKKMLLVQSQSYRQQYGFSSIYLLPVNLYGPGDNFDVSSSHVIPALIRKIFEAKRKGSKKVLVWGTGRATREFLFVEDAARAIYLATKYYDKPAPINIGAGFEISIRDLVMKIQTIIGYNGSIVWDTNKPDGQPRRMLNIDKAKKEFGFSAETGFDKGLRKTIEWYEKTTSKQLEK